MIGLRRLLWIYIENKIVNNFFNKSSRDRILYELRSVEKREHFFDKISHRCEDYIDDQFIVQKSNKLIGIDIIKQKLCSQNRMCYVIAYKSDLDGKFVDFKTAMDELWGNGPYLVCSVDGNSLYLETEYNFNVHQSYILSK